MSDPRYSAGVLQGISLSRRPGGWPPEIPGLGPAVFGKLQTCGICRARLKNPQSPLDGGWITYGGKCLCKFHAIELVRKAEEQAATASAAPSTTGPSTT